MYIDKQPFIHCWIQLPSILVLLFLFYLIDLKSFINKLSWANKLSAKITWLHAWCDTISALQWKNALKSTYIFFFYFKHAWTINTYSKYSKNTTEFLHIIIRECCSHKLQYCLALTVQILVLAAGKIENLIIVSRREVFNVIFVISGVLTSKMYKRSRIIITTQEKFPLCNWAPVQFENSCLILLWIAGIVLFSITFLIWKESEMILIKCAFYIFIF